MSDFTIEQLEAMRKEIPPAPWGFQSWGYQNQNGDYSESLLLDGGGEIIVLELPDRVGDAVAILPDLIDALIAEKRKNDDLCQKIGSLIGKLETRADNADSNRAYALAVAYRESERDLARILKDSDG